MLYSKLWDFFLFLIKGTDIPGQHCSESIFARLKGKTMSPRAGSFPPYSPSCCPVVWQLPLGTVNLCVGQRDLWGPAHSLHHASTALYLFLPSREISGCSEPPHVRDYKLFVPGRRKHKEKAGAWVLHARSASHEAGSWHGYINSCVAMSFTKGAGSQSYPMLVCCFPLDFSPKFSHSSLKVDWNAEAAGTVDLLVCKDGQAVTLCALET